MIIFLIKKYIVILPFLVEGEEKAHGSPCHPTVRLRENDWLNDICDREGFGLIYWISNWFFSQVDSEQRTAFYKTNDIPRHI